MRKHMSPRPFLVSTAEGILEGISVVVRWSYSSHWPVCDLRFDWWGGGYIKTALVNLYFSNIGCEGVRACLEGWGVC